MKTNLKNIFGAGLFALAFSVGATAAAAAESCAVPPSCADLGYIRSASECATAALKCPFDQTKYYCLTSDELEDIKPSNCAIGDILYSDKTCNANVVASKKPIGVVFDSTNRLAIALNTSSMKWSTEYFDIPNLDITSPSAAKADWQGKGNTATIISYCQTNSKSCPAAEYANSYTTDGTNAGDWYLPAGGELNAIYGNKDVLNTALDKMGGTALPDNYHWSSSEYDNYSAWSQRFSDGFIHFGYSKGSYNYYVRPVLAF